MSDIGNRAGRKGKDNDNQGNAIRPVAGTGKGYCLSGLWEAGQGRRLGRGAGPYAGGRVDPHTGSATASGIMTNPAPGLTARGGFVPSTSIRKGKSMAKHYTIKQYDRANWQVIHVSGLAVTPRLSGLARNVTKVKAEHIAKYCERKAPHDSPADAGAALGRQFVRDFMNWVDPRFASVPVSRQFPI